MCKDSPRRGFLGGNVIADGSFTKILGRDPGNSRSCRNVSQYIRRRNSQPASMSAVTPIRAIGQNW